MFPLLFLVILPLRAILASKAAPSTNGAYLAHLDGISADYRPYPLQEYGQGNARLMAPHVIAPVHFDNFVTYYEMKPVGERLLKVLHLLTNAPINALHQQVIKAVNDEQFSSAVVYDLEEELSALIETVLAEPFVGRYPTLTWIIAESIKFAVIPKYLLKNGGQGVVIHHSLTDLFRALRPTVDSSKEAKVDGALSVQSADADERLLLGLPDEILELIAVHYPLFRVISRLLNKSMLAVSNRMERDRSYSNTRLALLSTPALLSALQNHLHKPTETLRAIMSECPILTAVCILFLIKDTKVRQKNAHIVKERLRDLKPTGLVRQLLRMASGDAACEEPVKQAVRFALLELTKLFNATGGLQLSSPDSVWRRCKALKNY